MKRIVAIAGKPGLYSLVSQGKNMLIVENIETKKRTPAYASDKVISLGDIAMYTYGEDVPLYDVMQAVADKNDGKPVDLKQFATADAIREYFGEILPDYDRERVYTNDIKKLLAWYNILVGAGVTKFKDDDIAEDKAADAADPQAAETYDTKDTGLDQ